MIVFPYRSVEQLVHTQQVVSSSLTAANSKKGELVGISSNVVTPSQEARSSKGAPRLPDFVSNSSHTQQQGARSDSKNRAHQRSRPIARCNARRVAGRVSQWCSRPAAFLLYGLGLDRQFFNPYSGAGGHRLRDGLQGHSLERIARWPVKAPTLAPAVFSLQS